MPAPCVVGVDLGGTKALVGVLDAELRVQRRARRPVAGLDQEALLRMVVELVLELARDAAGDVTAVGIGVPCLIDRRTGRVVTAVHVPLSDYPLRDVLAERLGLPVFVDNDANMATLAEHRLGAARGARDAVMLTIGTGIGGGLVLDGRLYGGALGSGAELGHMVIDADGPPCSGNCPNRGCLEAMASGRALEREAQRLAAERPESGLARAAQAGQELGGAFVVELAHDGDETARAAVELIGRNLGVGLANLANIFNPEVAVVGGGVIGAGELLLEPARAEVAARALMPSRDFMRIVPAHFGEEAGMIGAAALARDGLAARS